MKRLLAAFAIVGLLGAAPMPLTFSDAVHRATSDGFSYQTALSIAAGSDAQASVTIASTRPTVSIAGTAINWNQRQLGFPVSNQLYVSAKASVPLIDPILVHGARAANLSALGSGTAGDLGTARDDAALAAARAYRRAQLAQAILLARRTASTDQREHVRRTDEQIAAGKMPQYIAARDRAQLAIAEQAEEDASAEVDEALDDLTALLALPIDVPVTISDALTPMDVTGDRDTFIKRALLQRPDITAAHSYRLAAEQTLASVQSAFSPTLTLNAESYNGTSTPNVGRSGGLISLNANLPIVDGGSRQADIAKAKARLEQARIMEAQSRRYAVRDVADAWRELVAARLSIQSANATLQYAHEQLRVVRLREHAGKAIDLESLDALSLVASAREGQAAAVARLDLAVSVLRRTVGDAQI